MSRLIKFFWFLTTILFLVVLLWVYSYLPQEVGYYADQKGIANEFVSREGFFYLVLAVFVLTNAILYSLRSWINKSLAGLEYTGYTKQQVMKKEVADWLLAFAASLNIFYILAMIFLSLFNNPEGVNLSSYGLVVYAGPVLIGIMVLLLVFILVKKRAEKQV